MNIFKHFSTILGLSLAFCFANNDLQAQCTTCTPNLPAMPADTIYLDSFPNARKGVYYEQTASFRFPYTTTPLAVIAPGTPANIALQSFEITGVSGLPLGLTYTPDRTPMLYNESSPDTRDGCIKVCGTPQQSGVFVVNVGLLINVNIIGPTTQNIPITFIVEPDTSATFTMDTTRGCAPLTVNFTNTVQTLGNETWAYTWNFGNGTTSTVENPSAVTYQDTGNYTVSMRAISTLALPRTFLSGISVTSASDCSDNVGPLPFPVDLFATIGIVNGAVDTVTPFVTDQNPSVAAPIIFNFGQDVQLQADSNYYVWIQDDDAVFGIGNPADCRRIFFSADTTPTRFTLTNGGLTVIVQLTRDTLFDRDTLFTEDIVVILNCDTTSVTQYELDNNVRFNIFPNPAREQVNINFELGKPTQEAQVRLFDALGRTVKTEVWNEYSQQFNRTLSLDQLQQGIYMLQIQVDGKVYNRKLILQP